MRAFLFVVVVLFVAQGVSTSFASVHALACHEQPAQGVAHDDVTEHDARPHSHHHVDVDSHPGKPDSSSDPVNSHSKAAECCGWFCTAAVMISVTSPMPGLPASRTQDLASDEAPQSLRKLGLDRPPRFQLHTI